MKIESKKNLLKEFEKVGHSLRVKKMYLSGIEERENPLFKKLIEELEKGDKYEKSLALYGIIGACYKEKLLPYLKDGSCLLRNIAAAGFFRVIENDNILSDEIEYLPVNTRKNLLKRVVTSGKKTLAEKLFPLVLNKYGTGEAIGLLPLCPEEMVKEYIYNKGESVKRWRNIARSYPDLTLEYIMYIFKSSPPRDYPTLWSRFNDAFEVFAESMPHKALEMVFTYCDENFLPFFVTTRFAFLVKKERDLLFRVITRPGYRKSLTAYGGPFRKFLIHIRKFSREQIIEAASFLRETPSYLQNLLSFLSPSRRGEIFTEVYKDIDTSGYEWDSIFLEVLPREIRQKEGERMLDLRKVKEQEARYLEVLSFCHIDKARDIFIQKARSPKAEERSLALSLLIKCIGRSGKDMDKTLKYLEKIKNEQDPVRFSVFSSLASQTHSVFLDSHSEDIEKLFEYIFEARDTSSNTSISAIQLASAFLHHKKPESKLFNLGLKIYKKLALKAGSVSFYYIAHNLPAGVEEKVVQALKPVILSFNMRERYGIVINLASSLGKRAWKVKDLQDMLKPVFDAKPDYSARKGISLWLSCPHTRDERVKFLLKKDKSVIAIPEVLNHLHKRRQEWLTPYLAGKVIKGAFLTGKTIYVPPLYKDFHRWTPSQEKAFARLLKKIIDDEKQSIVDRCRSIKALASLPCAEPEDIKKYLNEKDVNLQEGALHGLSLLDEPEDSIPVLMDYLDGDRARVAMYSLPRVLSSISPQKLKKICEELLGREKLKITVHKEAVRILGSVDDGSLLLKEWEKSPHRDVKIAIIRSSWRFMDKEEGRKILMGASEATDREILRSLLEKKPQGLEKKEREFYLNLLLNLTEHGDGEVRKESFVSLRNWTTGFEELIGEKAKKSIVNIEGGWEWQEALITLVSAAGDGRCRDTVIGTVSELMNMQVEENMNCTPQRDIPHVQRFFRIINFFTSMSLINRMKIKGLLAELAALFREPFLWGERAALSIACASPADPDEFIETVRTFPEVSGDTSFFYNTLLIHVNNIFTDSAFNSEEGKIFRIIDAFISSSPEKEHMALALLNIYGRKTLWNEECRKRLKKFRNSSHASVRGMAFTMYTSFE